MPTYLKRPVEQRQGQGGESIYIDIDRLPLLGDKLLEAQPVLLISAAGQSELRLPDCDAYY